jgi:hypothetical protein
MMTAREPAEILGLSPRQIRRILAAYRRKGAVALAHGNRGRKPKHALNVSMKRRVPGLFQTIYKGCNHQHFTEPLVEGAETNLSRSSVRRILLFEAGLRSPRKRRAPKHRSELFASRHPDPETFAPCHSDPEQSGGRKLVMLRRCPEILRRLNLVGLLRVTLLNAVGRLYVNWHGELESY